jgi:hypothetical protein
VCVRMKREENTLTTSRIVHSRPHSALRTIGRLSTRDRRSAANDRFARRQRHRPRYRFGEEESSARWLVVRSHRHDCDHRLVAPSAPLLVQGDHLGAEIRDSLTTVARVSDGIHQRTLSRRSERLQRRRHRARAPSHQPTTSGRAGAGLVPSRDPRDSPATSPQPLVSASPRRSLGGWQSPPIE